VWGVSQNVHQLEKFTEKIQNQFDFDVDSLKRIEIEMSGT
jgi:hypothetical protein